jgi:hypothetical protein
MKGQARLAQPYKRFWEKVEIYPYGYKYNNRMLNYAVFTRLGKVTGTAVVAEAGRVGREAALHAAWHFFQFNRVILEAADQLTKDINQPADSIEQSNELLRRSLWLQEFQMERYMDQVIELQNVFELAVAVKSQLNRLLQDMQTIEQTMLQRGYLQDEDTARMIELNVLHYRTMYHQGKELVRVLPMMEQLQRHFDSLQGKLDGVHEQARKQLYMLMDSFTRRDAVAKLLKSNASFEKDEYGQPVQMPEKEDRFAFYETKLRHEIAYIFRKKVVPQLRNR